MGIHDTVMSEASSDDYFSSGSCSSEESEVLFIFLFFILFDCVWISVRCALHGALLSLGFIAPILCQERDPTFSTKRRKVESPRADSERLAQFQRLLLMTGVVAFVSAIGVGVRVVLVVRSQRGGTDERVRTVIFPQSNTRRF